MAEPTTRTLILSEDQVDGYVRNIRALCALIERDGKDAVVPLFNAEKQNTTRITALQALRHQASYLETLFKQQNGLVRRPVEAYDADQENYPLTNP